MHPFIWEYTLNFTDTLDRKGHHHIFAGRAELSATSHSELLRNSACIHVTASFSKNATTYMTIISDDALAGACELLCNAGVGAPAAPEPALRAAEVARSEHLRAVNACYAMREGCCLEHAHPIDEVQSGTEAVLRSARCMPLTSQHDVRTRMLQLLS